jgi:hypothetical protein
MATDILRWQHISTTLAGHGKHWVIHNVQKNIRKALGDSQRAKEYFQRAYSIFREFYGDEHPSTKTAKWLRDSVK